VRGRGGVLRNEKGEAFMLRYHRLADLAPRDIVARAIHAEIRRAKKFDHVFLDITHLKGAFIKKHFPNITRRCAELGLDITREPIPVVPAAHYMCGGVVTDARGRTDIAGLFTAGEVAFTGMHGANRLASNSLEAVCFAELAAKESRRSLSRLSRIKSPVRLYRPGGKKSPPDLKTVAQKRKQLRETMSEFVGIVRTRQEIARAKKTVTDIRRWADLQFRQTCLSGEVIELRNLAQVAELITIGAHRRVESRGLHFLHEKPRRDDARWNKDNLIKPRTR